MKYIQVNNHYMLDSPLETDASIPLPPDPEESIPLLDNNVECIRSVARGDGGQLDVRG